MPPPAPPLSPTLLIPLSPVEVRDDSRRGINLDLESNRCIGNHLEAAELIKTVLRRRPDLDGRCMLSHYTAVTPLLQTGPMCGLVALSMALDALGDGALTPERLLQLARNKGFSKEGEMFSVSEMAELGNLSQSVSAHIIDNAGNNYKDIIKILLQGAILLVPYDADGNHEPCLKQGRKAHWATVSGIVGELPACVLASIPASLVTADTTIAGLHHLQTQTSGLSEEHFANITQSFVQHLDDVFVHAKQGKSKHTSIWSLKALLESNMNLRELDPKIAANISAYVTPARGMAEELANKLTYLSIS